MCATIQHTKMDFNNVICDQLEEKRKSILESISKAEAEMNMLLRRIKSKKIGL